MDTFNKMRLEAIARSLVEVLSQKGYDAHYAGDLAEAKKIMLSMIPEGATVGVGGSATIDEMGFLDELRSGRYQFYDRYAQNSFQEDLVQRRLSLTADFFVTGTNAITRKGELVNVDASGSRVSAMMFGPGRVIIAAGANKVVNTLDDAFERIKSIAPMNSMRYNLNTPCTEDAYCHDCTDPQRMCNYYSIIARGDKFPGRISVVIVAEDCGF